MSASGLDVDDVTGCPVAPVCGTCSAAAGDLAVHPVKTPLGVCCTTLCGGCAASGVLPGFPSWAAAVEAVGEHCGHLGCDVDEMAAALEAAGR